jgi:hypothetical protein
MLMLWVVQKPRSYIILEHNPRKGALAVFGVYLEFKAELMSCSYSKISNEIVERS